MKKLFFTLISVVAVFTATLGQNDEWPRTTTKNGATIITYQPQADYWENFTTLSFRMAFELFPEKNKPQVVGVIGIKAKTEVLTDEHWVLGHNIEILHINFPGVDSASVKRLSAIVKSFIPDTFGISLERVVASVPKKETASTVKVQNNPPVVIISKKPALLLQMEGKPVQADIAKTNLAFIINVNWPLFLDKKKPAYYLFNEKEWLTSETLNGKWKITTKLPAEMNELVKDSTWSSMKNAIPPPPASGSEPPVVFFSDKPAELIVFKGEPAFSKIANLNLVYATNTAGDVFMDMKDKSYYIVLGGRWFRSVSINGPWSYATDKLPADFAKIPYSSPAARVLVYVPGTEEAKDAVMIAQIPTKITVDPKTAPENVKINYNGEPEFAPIEGTTMKYATNTPDKVIRVGDLYYLCYQGIWFVSTTAKGPWQTASSIPSEIYTIPPSSPVYNVTYVNQTVTPNGYVTASYTTGYTGTYVVSSSTTVVIVSGTGYYHPPVYYYPPYGYPMYYPFPPPYGYPPYCYPYYGYHPYGGAYYKAGYNPATGTYGRSVTAYGPYGSATAGQAYNPYTGTAARGVSTSTPYGTNSYAQAYNPRTGTYAQTEQHSNANGQWGSSTVSNKYGQSATTAHATTGNTTVAAASTSSGAKAVGVSGQNSSAGAVKTSSGDVYAGKDGNVYKKTDDGWEQAGANQSQANKSQAATSSGQSASRQQTGTQSRSNSNYSNELNKQAQDRQRGNFQSQQFQGGAQSRGSYSGGSRSGGFSGGSRHR